MLELPSWSVVEDRKKAMRGAPELYREAHAAGGVDARGQLACMYLEGPGVAKDHTRAL